MAYLRIANLKKAYRVSRTEIQPVLKGINVEFKKGELVAVLGESGCGKSTFLNILGGLDNDYTGSIVLNGEFFKDYTEQQLDDYRKSKVGLIFQNYNLISHMSVKENVEVALTMNNVDNETRKSLVMDTLEKVGIKEYLDKLPRQLSGGQRQKVAIARALINDPEIVLADEPTGALDKENAAQVMVILKKIAEMGKLVIIVTHSHKVADQCSRVLTIDDGVIQSDVKNRDIDYSFPKVKKGKPQNIKFKDMLKLAISNLLQTRKRSLLVAIGMSIGIAAVILISCLSTGISNYVNDNIASEVNALQIQVTSEKSITKSQRNMFEDLDGVDYIVTGSYLKQNSEFNYNYNKGYIYLLQSTYDGLSDCLLYGENCEQDQIVINESFASAILNSTDYESAVGRTIDVTYSGYTKSMVVSGVYSDSSSNSTERCAYITDDTFEELYTGAGKSYVINTVYVYVEDTSYISSVKDAIEAFGFTANRSDSTVETLLDYIDLATKVLTGFSAVSLVVSAIMIFIVTYISVIERTKEIGILRAVGGRRKDVSILFVIESAILGIVSGIIAIAISLFISIVANLIMTAYIGSSIISISVVKYLIGLAISIVLGVGSGLLPALEAAKLDPVDSLRSE